MVSGQKCQFESGRRKRLCITEEKKEILRKAGRDHYCENRNKLLERKRKIYNIAKQYMELHEM